MISRKLWPRFSILGLMIAVAFAAIVSSFCRPSREVAAKASALAYMTKLTTPMMKLNTHWSPVPMSEMKATPLADDGGWKIEFWDPGSKTWNDRIYVEVDRDLKCNYVYIPPTYRCQTE